MTSTESLLTYTLLSIDSTDSLLTSTDSPQRRSGRPSRQRRSGWPMRQWRSGWYWFDYRFVEIKTATDCHRLPLTAMYCHWLAQAKTRRARALTFFFFCHWLALTGTDCYWLSTSAASLLTLFTSTDSTCVYQLLLTLYWEEMWWSCEQYSVGVVCHAPEPDI